MSGTEFLESYDAATCPKHQHELFGSLYEFLKTVGKEIGATEAECIQHFEDIQKEAFNHKVPINLS
jgi:hypothetical protein